MPLAGSEHSGNLFARESFVVPEPCCGFAAAVCARRGGFIPEFDPGMVMKYTRA